MEMQTIGKSRAALLNEQMNNLQNWNYEGHEVRTVLRDGEPWFVAADVCKVLEISNPSQAMTRLDEDEKMTLTSNEGHSGSRGGAQMMNVVNEPGVYALILSSRKPEARAFKRWVTHEVLPTIRRHGIYATDDVLDRVIADPSFGIRLLTELKEEREKRAVLEIKAAALEETVDTLETENAALVPKASYCDHVLHSPELVTITKIAKDYGWSGIRMNNYLHEKGIQFRSKDTWLLYAEYADKGYTQSKTYNYQIDGEDHCKMHTSWTQKGRLFLYDLLKADGILPVCERPESAAAAV